MRLGLFKVLMIERRTTISFMTMIVVKNITIMNRVTIAIQTTKMKNPKPSPVRLIIHQRLIHQHTCIMISSKIIRHHDHERIMTPTRSASHLWIEYKYIITPQKVPVLLKKYPTFSALTHHPFQHLVPNLKLLFGRVPSQAEQLPFLPGLFR